MISIELKDVHIHAFHGIYEGEEKIGNPYIINLEVQYDGKISDFDDVRTTINYVDLFDIVKQRMQIPTGLLEKVCQWYYQENKTSISFC